MNQFGDNVSLTKILGNRQIAEGTVTDDVLSNTTVTPGTYTGATVTVNEKGRITAAASNPAPTDQFFPSGFINRTDSEYSLDVGTRTFTIQPTASSYAVYVGGTKVIKTAPESITIPDENAIFLVYFEAVTNELTYRPATVLSSGFIGYDGQSEVPVAAIWWSADAGGGRTFDQRYGISMAWTTRAHIFETKGYEHVSGLDLINTTTSGDGSQDAHAQVSLTDGTIRNADLQARITHAATPSAQWQQILNGPAQIGVSYRVGPSTQLNVQTFAHTNFPVHVGTTRPQYNFFDGENWTLAEVPSGKYFVMYLYTILADQYPIVSGMDTVVYDDLREVYDTLDWVKWRNAILPVLVNIRPLYALVYHTDDSYTNAVKARLVETIDLRSVSNNSTLDHKAFSGLEDDSHQQYVANDISRTITAQHTFAPVVEQPAFVLGANAQGQLITGLNAEKLSGVTVAELQPADADLTALANTSSTGVYVRTGAGTSATRTITGTTDQISVSNGNGVSANPTIAIADNPVFSGTAGITVPSGDTSQRGTGATGKFRVNSELGKVETYVDGTWQQLVFDTDKRLNATNTLVVSKDVGLGQFSSIKAAMDSIVGASELQPWAIMVEPGTYVEDPIDFKSHVHVVGTNRRAVKILANNPNANLINAAPAASISEVTLGGATGTDCALINFEPVVDGDTFHAIDLHFLDGYYFINLLVNSGINIGIVDSADLTMDVSAVSHIPFKCQSIGGGLAYLYINSYRTRFLTAPYHLIDVQGPNSVIGIFNTFVACDELANTCHALHVLDGAQLTVQSSELLGFGTGLHVPYTGTAPLLAVLNVYFSSLEYDILIQHPEVNGTFIGSIDESKVSINELSPISCSFTHNVTPGMTITGELFIGETAAHVTNVTDLIIEAPPTGLLSGGELSGGTGLNAHVEAGIGYCHDDNGQVIRVHWDEVDVPVVANTSSYIYVTNTGVVSAALSEPSGFATVVIGFVTTDASSVITLGERAVRIQHHGNRIDNMLRETAAVAFAFGSIVSENTTTPRAIDVTAGRWYWGSQVRNPSAKTAPSMLDYYHVAGVGTYTSVAVVPNDTYNDGTDLVNLQTGYYVKHMLLQVNEGAYQRYFLIHGTSEHSTLIDARNADLPPYPTALEGAPRIAALIMQEGTNSIVEIIDIRPMFMRQGGVSLSGGSGVTVHANLSGLLADDHLQYLPLTGSRSMSGALNMGSNNITNVGTINGLNISSHGARHGANSVDAVPTAAAVSLSSSSTNTAGIADTLARSDHTHQISGFQPLDADLTAVAALTGTGLGARTAANTWAVRTIDGTADQIVVTNGNAAAGNPTIALATAGTPGTYVSVDTDQHGRVVSGSSTQVWSTLTDTPTTLSGYGITDAQPLDVDLTALANTTGTGLYAITASGTSATRTLTAPAAGLTISNGNGVSGNPTFALADDLAAVEALSTTGIAVRYGADLWITRALAGTANQISVTNGDGVAGSPVFSLSADPIIPGTSNLVLPTGTTAQEVGTVNGALRYNTTTGTLRMRQAGSWLNIGTVTSVGITAPAAGITVSGSPVSTSGNITLSLADDLAALEGLAGSGFAVRTAANTWAQRSITNGSPKISISNGDGVAGNTSIDVVEANLTLNNIGGVLSTAKGGTGLSSIGTAYQVFGVNATGTALEYKTVNQGAGITFTPVAGSYTITNSGVLSISGGTTGLTPATATTGAVTLGGVLVVANGGTGLSATPTNGQIDIGNGTGFTRTTITPGSGVTIANGAGSIKVSVGATYYGTVPPSSGNTQIPATNSQPTVAQGTELWSQTITPESTNSKFIIDFSSMVGVSNNNRGVTFALFRGTTFIGSAVQWTDADKPQVSRIYIVDSPATAASVTYSLRVGVTGNTWYVGQSNNFNHGGITQSLWTIKEIL